MTNEGFQSPELHVGFFFVKLRATSSVLSSAVGISVFYDILAGRLRAVLVEVKWYQNEKKWPMATCSILNGNFSQLPMFQREV